MEYKLETRALSQIDADVLVVGFFQDENIKETLKKLDEGLPDDFAASVADECQRESFGGKIGQAIQLPTYGRIKAKRLVVRGLGKKSDVTPTSVRKAAGSVARKIVGHTDCATTALELRLESDAFVQAAVEGWLLGSYSFSKYKTKAEERKKKQQTQTLFIVCHKLSEAAFAQACKRGAAIAEATNAARDMVAEPAQYMTPTRLAEIAQKLAHDNLSVQIVERDQAQEMGMGAFLGVARGAKEPPKFIIIRYSHANAKKTIGIAGKGITFDSGGLSMKTAVGMEHMKYDMSGAAAVIATMQAVQSLQPAINVVAVAAATENMPGGSAMHPGDILKAMNGKTIEVNNTDAEGRLVLADALSFLTQEKTDEIIDLATLTGAVVTALGRAAAGVMGTDGPLIKRLIEAGAQAGEKYWELPMFEEYKDALKSDIADLKNAGAKGEAPSSAAAMFLKEFVDSRPWAHLDIAGPAWLDKEKEELNKGGTAFGVRTLCYYLLSQSAS